MPRAAYADPDVPGSAEADALLLPLTRWESSQAIPDASSDATEEGEGAALEQEPAEP
jgi:hypothetical protein